MNLLFKSRKKVASGFRRILCAKKKKTLFIFKNTYGGNNTSLYRTLLIKDQTEKNVQSDLDLHCPLGILKPGLAH